MLKNIFLRYKIEVTIKANRLIYYFKKIPIIGNLLKNSEYNSQNLKLFFTIISIIFDILSKIFRNAIYIGFLVIFIASKYNIENVENIAFNIWLFLSCISSTIQLNNIYTTDQNDITLLKYFKYNPKKLIISNISFKLVFNFIIYCINISIFKVILKAIGYNISTSILSNFFTILIEYICFKLIGDAICLIYFNKNKKLITNSILINLFTLLVPIVGAYLLPCFKIVLNIYPLLSSFYIFSILIILGILSLEYIKRFKQYEQLKVSILENNESIYTISDETSKKQLFGDSLNWNKSIKKDKIQEDAQTKYEGSDYLNHLFFERHKNFFKKKVKSRSIMILAIMLILIVFLKLIQNKENYEKMYNSIELIMPILMFIMYLISIGKNITQALFSNCDISLLNYNFYRKKDVIIKGFNYRFKKILEYNSILAVLIYLSYVALIILGHKFTLEFFLTSFISMTIIYILTSFNDLFIYYILQPYTSDYGQKSPMFSIVNTIIYILIYSFQNMRLISLKFMIVISIIGIAYILIGYILLNKYSEKTFKLK